MCSRRKIFPAGFLIIVRFDMTNKEIFEIMDRFEGSSLRSMKLTNKDFTIELEKGGTPAAACTPAVREEKLDDAIVAPLVGVYYAAPAPDAEPFVKVGQKLRKGDTVCLMEAMKMLSEVAAPCDCVITEILKENGALAAFEEPLFRYKPC